MDYIINPWWIYGIQLIQGLHIFLFCLVVFVALVSGYHSIRCLDDRGNLIPLEERLPHQRKAKRYAVIFFVLLFVQFLFPSRKTMYEMLFASMATKQNIQTVHDYVANDLTNALDKITEAAIKIEKAKNKED